ncbi:MAG: hypothetical protein QNJ53_09470 [Pleurocapsa sp. MO_192.B19]|nr:hypothetical protein [Pleurocapsa sp. MO_192.B19]
MLNEIIAIYAITEDLLNALGHQEDCRCVMNDAEVITAALVAAKHFDSNQHQACEYLQEQKMSYNRTMAYSSK